MKRGRQYNEAGWLLRFELGSWSSLYCTPCSNDQRGISEDVADVACPKFFVIGLCYTIFEYRVS